MGKRPRDRKLAHEPLERRQLLAVAVANNDGLMRITSDHPNDPLNESVSLDVDPAAGTLLVRGTGFSGQHYQLTQLKQVNVDLGAGNDFYQLGVRDTAGTDAVMAQLGKMSFGAWLKIGTDRAVLDIRNSAVKAVTVDGGQGDSDRLEVLKLTPAQFRYSGFEIVRGTVNTPIAGWSGVTGFHTADTTVERAIVSNASAAIGQSSGQSRLFDPTIDIGTAWFTDASGGDGQRMRDAIGIYHNWFIGSHDHGNVPQNVRDKMIAALGDAVPPGQGYSARDKEALANRIIDQYNRSAQAGPVSIPTNDNATLQFLGIRAQCVEWISKIAIASGGQARGYNTPGVTVTNPADFRPGMGLLLNNRHAMLITDIEWDANGNPIRYRVAEANAAGSSWSNPVGDVPWERTVSAREISAATPGLRVIRME